MFSISDLTESVQWPLTMNIVITKYRPLKTTKNYSTRTISNVKEVVDNRVRIVHDLKTNSVITAWLLLRNNLKTQFSVSADETLELATLLADQNLEYEDFHLVLSKICTKERPCFSNRSTKGLSLYYCLRTILTPKVYWFLPTCMGSIPMRGLIYN